MSESVVNQLLRILVVDDSRPVVEGISCFLKNQPGVVVVGSAINGREAIEKTAQYNPDLVLMDVNMPEMNGLEAAASMRIQFPNVRIILISIDQDPVTRKDCLEHGADCFLPKIGLQRTIMMEVKSLFQGVIA